MKAKVVGPLEVEVVNMVLEVHSFAGGLPYYVCEINATRQTRFLRERGLLGSEELLSNDRFEPIIDTSQNPPYYFY